MTISKVDTTEPLKFLVVEDDADISEALVTYAKHRGFITFHAKDGFSAIELGKREMPDVILLDIALPGLDGRDVFVQLQKDGITKKAVVIFATARDSQSDRIAGLELGADEYETKPFQLATLFTKIDALLAKKRSGYL
ncbi:MAG: response regulator [Deltaproteobacteria bacterium]|nr:response regulator [Deltaproteobacteria bacterium]